LKSTTIEKQGEVRREKVAKEVAKKRCLDEKEGEPRPF